MARTKKPPSGVKQSSKPITICKMTRSEVKNDLAIIVNTDWCKGCGFCVEFCPAGVLKPSSQVNLKWKIKSTM